MKQQHPIRVGLSFALAAAFLYLPGGRYSAMIVLYAALLAALSGSIAWIAVFHRATVTSWRAAIAGILAAFVTVTSGLVLLMYHHHTPLRRAPREFWEQLNTISPTYTAVILAVFAATGLVLAHWSHWPPTLSAFSLPMPLVSALLFGLTAGLTVALRCQIDPLRPNNCARLATLAGFFAAALGFLVWFLLRLPPSFSLAAGIAMGSSVVTVSLPLARVYAAATYWSYHPNADSLSSLATKAFYSGLRVNSWIGFVLGGLAGALIAASEEKNDDTTA